MSSSLLTRPFDILAFGLGFMLAQYVLQSILFYRLERLSCSLKVDWEHYRIVGGFYIFFWLVYIGIICIAHYMLNINDEEDRLHLVGLFCIIALLVLSAHIILYLNIKEKVNTLKYLRDIKESEVMLKMIIDSTSEGIWISDKKNKIIFSNKKMSLMLGLNSSEQLLGKDVFECVSNEPFSVPAMPKESRYSITDRSEICFMSGRGRSIPATVAFSVLYDKNKEYVGVLAMVTDITDIKESEEMLSMLHNAVENAKDSIVISDINGTVTYANQATLDITGYLPEELLGKKTNIFKSGLHEAEFYGKVWDEILSGKTVTTTFINRKKDGTLFHEEKTIAPFKNKQQSITNFLSVGRDITERIKMEEELRALNSELENRVEQEVTKRLMVEDEAKLKERENMLLKERYHTQQEHDAFKKQMKIIRDTLSHKQIQNIFFSSYYKPLDILSGDSYGMFSVGKGLYFLYIVDAMGKGLSASVTSIQTTSFINNAADMAVRKGDFSFEKMVGSYCDFIKKQLIKDELLCVVFLLIDTKIKQASYANFAMPPILLQLQDGSVQEVLCNNRPIMPRHAEAHIDTFAMDKVDKILVASDGLFDNHTDDGVPYSYTLEEEFKNACFANQFIKSYEEKVTEFDDDVTMIFLKQLLDAPHLTEAEEYDNSISGVVAAVVNSENHIMGMGLSELEIEELQFAVNEIAMNALEHGNLAISYDKKQELMQEFAFDEYVETLVNTESNRQKKIRATYVKYSNPTHFALVSIKDEGSGFDVSEVLKTISLSWLISYNGRGMEMTDDKLDGLFYNETGNEATIIKVAKRI